jgi:uncharacterized protein YjbI with pentapeptide repeats
MCIVNYVNESRSNERDDWHCGSYRRMLGSGMAIARPRPGEPSGQLPKAALYPGDEGLLMDALGRTRARGETLDISGHALRGLNLDGRDLTGLVARRSDWSDTSCSRARLDGVDLSRSTLARCSLTGASLREVIAEGVSARDANFDGVQASRSVWQEADLRGASITGADFSQADLKRSSLVATTLIGTDFRGARMGASAMAFANAADADFTGAHLPMADLRGSVLIGTNLDGAILVNARLAHADVTGMRGEPVDFVLDRDEEGCQSIGMHSVRDHRGLGRRDPAVRDYRWSHEQLEADSHLLRYARSLGLPIIR